MEDDVDSQNHGHQKRESSKWILEIFHQTKLITTLKNYQQDEENTIY